MGPSHAADASSEAYVLTDVFTKNNYCFGKFYLACQTFANLLFFNKNKIFYYISILFALFCFTFEDKLITR